ncbi:MAG TPA: SMC family ATPase [Ktedonobacteraceae bacterium]|nr:SMC family ATPase [Ktedonobacteraceae bacterium]
MIPLQVTLEGFLSYREKQVINFDGSSLWVLWGPNGVGKSAVFDAITFALFGTHRANRKTKGSTDELINHHSDKLIVTFDFIVDGIIYRIKRIHPRKGRSTREAFIVESSDISNLENARTKRIDNTDSEDGLNQWVRQTIGMNDAAFTSSCLLLQGKSEQLLDADARGRYTILAELIDLSRYQKLCEAAEKRRGTFKATIDSLVPQLLSPSVRPVSDEEMDATQLQLKQTDENWQQAQDAVGHFTGYLEQARHWEEDKAKRQKKWEELQQAQELLESEDEITNGVAGLRDLQRVLPALGQIVQSRTLLLKLQEQLDSLQCQQHGLEGEVHVAEEKSNTAQRQVTNQAQAIADLQQTSNRYAIRLSELAPIVSKLEHVEQLQTQIANLEEQLAAFPSDITQRLTDAEQQLRILDEKAYTLPWLKTFARERTDLGDVLRREQAATTSLETLRGRFQELRDSRTILQIACTDAQDAEKRLFGEKQSGSTRLTDAQKRLQRFENVAVRPVCDLCGQEIAGDHVLKEKTRLQQQIDECQRNLTKVQDDYQHALSWKQEKEEELSALDIEIGEVKNTGTQYKHECQTAHNQAKQHARRLCEAFDAIPQTFQLYVIATAPEDNEGWLTTVYPTTEDIDAIQQEAKKKNTQADYVAQLRNNFNDWQSLASQRTVFERQLAEQMKAVDIGVAENARTEKNDTEQKQKVLVDNIGGQQQVQEQAKETAQETDTVFKGLEKQLLECQNSIHIETARQESEVRVQHTRIDSLPASWQRKVDTLDEAGLIVLEQQRDNLVCYDLLYSQLTESHQRVSLYKKDIEALDEQIVEYPLEAKRPASEVERELSGKKIIQKQAGDERDQLKSVLTRLEGMRQLRQELEQQKLEAEKFYHLYDVLAKHLGRSGLQLYLLNRAEDAIVEFANQILNGLSHGRMRLELRSESDALPRTEKALDLVVHDRDTGEYAESIALVSGSQKFRIAVSLALAIGRYSSREAHHIESVIIDEGFGSLDRAGRDDMIQELSTLGQQLSRIILVSHQEEFAYAFPNRYSLKLVEGASHVTLMEEE